jgi:hypothetical protein
VLYVYIYIYMFFSSSNWVMALLGFLLFAPLSLCDEIVGR